MPPDSIMISMLMTLFLSMATAIPTSAADTLVKKQAQNCPLYLPSNNFEFPHLIVPISQVSPHAILGNSFTPAVSPNDFATIFNFDIPASRTGQTCTLYFSFPTQSQLVTTSYTYWGAGTFSFVQYQNNTGVTATTTWNTQPSASGSQSVTLTQVAPGRAYKVWTGTCPVGLLSWRMSSTDSCMWYFQDFNECAIGVYIVYG